MIVRAPRPESGFTIIRNDVLNDERLSYRARGILASILSKPDNWHTDYRVIAREGKEGKSAVRAALAELRDVGYIVQTRRQEKSGRWVTDMLIHDTPQTMTDEASSHVAPSVGKPNLGGPNPGKPTLITSTDTKDCYKDLGSTSSTTGPVGVDHPLRGPVSQPQRDDHKPIPKARARERWTRDQDIDLFRAVYDGTHADSAYRQMLADGQRFPGAFLRALADRGQADGFLGSKVFDEPWEDVRWCFEPTTGAG